MELRKFMLKNPNSVKLFDYLNRLKEAHIEMNFQIVLCAEVNDGVHLDKSIEDLSKFIPFGKSMSIVPFGQSAHREGLYPLRLFTAEECRDIIKQVEAWQNKLLEENGTRFCYLSDEFYLTAGVPLPKYDDYEGFPQLENGVGMLTLMEDEFSDCLAEIDGDDKKRKLSIATGEIAYNFISRLCKAISQKLTNTEISVYAVKNKFFGETITVSGLLTGKDIIEQLKGKPLGDFLLIPENALRVGSTALLDDTEIKDIEKELGVKVVVSSDEGHRFIQQIKAL
jgi:putative radical SAM enzyme (TIGR03279 family)